MHGKKTRSAIGKLPQTIENVIGEGMKSFWKVTQVISLSHFYPDPKKLTRTVEMCWRGNGIPVEPHLRHLKLCLELNKKYFRKVASDK